MKINTTYQRQVDAGTEFCLRVRFKRSNKIFENETTLAAPETAPKFSGRKVLLVDDIEVNRELAHALLKDFNIEFVTAVNGAEAVAAAIRVPVDLVLMDVQMPVMKWHDKSGVKNPI